MAGWKAFSQWCKNKSKAIMESRWRVRRMQMIRGDHLACKLVQRVATVRTTSAPNMSEPFKPGNANNATKVQYC